MSITALEMASCAAAFRPSKATIDVSSSPVHASVVLGGNTLGVTPARVEVPRQGPSIVHVRKEGYEQGQFSLERRISTGWLIADVATCVIPVLLCIPLIVDGATGAWMNTEPSYAVSLERTTASQSPPVSVPVSPQQPPIDDIVHDHGH